MSNVEHILLDERARNAMASSAIEVDHSIFFRRESGLLCAVDLAGYGTALSYALENMHSFNDSPAAIQDTFRKSVAAQFAQMLGRLGVMQVQTAGDGFLATFPARVFELRGTIDRLLREWGTVVARVKQLNSSIRNPDYQVGSRMALHFGDYEYGRTCGARSINPAFDGAAIIEVARLEQALAIATRRAPEPSYTTPPLSPKNHYIVFSKALRSTLGLGWAPESVNIRRQGELNLEAKEFRDIGELWEVYPDLR
jgi:hypothetical protein